MEDILNRFSKQLVSLLLTLLACGLGVGLVSAQAPTQQQVNCVVTRGQQVMLQRQLDFFAQPKSADPRRQVSIVGQPNEIVTLVAGFLDQTDNHCEVEVVFDLVNRWVGLNELMMALQPAVSATALPSTNGGTNGSFGAATPQATQAAAAGCAGETTIPNQAGQLSVPDGWCNALFTFKAQQAAGSHTVLLVPGGFAHAWANGTASEFVNNTTDVRLVTIARSFDAIRVFGTNDKNGATFDRDWEWNHLIDSLNRDYPRNPGWTGVRGQ
jgi:hypothetical protein